MKSSRFNSPWRKAFTSIELLVVVAVLAILVTVFLPAITSPKLRSTLAVCLNNQHKMGLAFIMYTTDNSDNTPQGIPPAGFKSAGGYWLLDSAAPGSWGGNSTTALADVQGCLDTNSIFAPYLGDPSANHCPGDVRYKNPIGSGNTTCWAYDSYAVTANVTSNNLSYYPKLMQITRTADCIILTEQVDSRGYNSGSFAVLPPGVTPTAFPYADLFAIYHGNEGTFCFADGHAASHTWTDPSIIAVGKLANLPNTFAFSYSSGQNALNLTPAFSGTADSTWLCQHWLTPSNP